jgi:diketogulonate reductase-like aldo/keto reductase
LGVYGTEVEETRSSVLFALKYGFRHIDTASCYRNEREVGSAIKKSLVPREDIYVTTKVWDTDHGYDATMKAFHESLRKLDTDYVNLYLIHSPLGGKLVETWDAMVELQRKGLVKSIGVSNFNVHHLEGLRKARPDHIPVVNQIELSPFTVRDEIISYCQKVGIVLVAYSPLTRGIKLKDPRLVELSKKYNKSVAQILIRWCIQRGFVCIPKSVKESRIRENSDVFDFSISEDDITAMNGMNEDLWAEWDPEWQPLTNPWEG